MITRLAQIGTCLRGRGVCTVGEFVGGGDDGTGVTPSEIAFGGFTDAGEKPPGLAQIGTCLGGRGVGAVGEFVGGGDGVGGVTPSEIARHAGAGGKRDKSKPEHQAISSPTSSQVSVAVFRSVTPTY